MMKKSILLIISIALTLVISSCGYHELSIEKIETADLRFKMNIASNSLHESETEVALVIFANDFNIGLCEMNRSFDLGTFKLDRHSVGENSQCVSVSDGDNSKYVIYQKIKISTIKNVFNLSIPKTIDYYYNSDKKEIDKIKLYPNDIYIFVVNKSLKNSKSSTYGKPITSFRSYAYDKLGNDHSQYGSYIDGEYGYIKNVGIKTTSGAGNEFYTIKISDNMPSELDLSVQYTEDDKARIIKN